MTFSVTAEYGTPPYDTTILLTGGDPFSWLAESGMGVPPLHGLSERGPQQHGSSLQTFRLDDRVLTVAIGIHADTYSDYWTHRETLVKLFSPSISPIKLNFTLDNGEIRTLDVFPEEISFDSSERQGYFHRAAFRVRAHNPVFYSPTLQAVTFEYGAGVAGFDVPTPVPTPIGASTIMQSYELTYNGTWIEYPVIRAFGPIDDFIISISHVNIGSGNTITYTLDFSGSSVADGDWLEIDLRYGNKTVVDSAGANQIGLLSDDSDLGTFHIERPRIAYQGTNTITVYGNNTSSSSVVQVQYYERFLGI